MGAYEVQHVGRPGAGGNLTIPSLDGRSLICSFAPFARYAPEWPVLPASLCYLPHSSPAELELQKCSQGPRKCRIGSGKVVVVEFRLVF